MANDTSHQNRPYQGYPSVDLGAFHAPSIYAATASSRPDLPTNPITRQPPRSSSPRSDSASITNNQNQKRRKASEDRAVIYIDLPEDTTSEVTRRDLDTGNDEAFVENTIFYDPFEDRRIDVRSERSSRTESTERPTRLAIPTYSGEEPSQTVNSFTHSPHFVYKETRGYPQSPTDDGLRLPPLPVPEYPDPPPAYTEVDITRERQLPRTQVLVPEQQNAVRLNANRKLITCPYCGQRVLTLTTRESGALTHVLGVVALLMFFPLTLCVYCTDCCKYRNHYCPQCNQHIAYEVPILCQGIVYTKI